MTLDPVIVLVARFALGWLFVAAAFAKLKNIAEFERTLAGYRIVPAPLERASAWSIGALELATGIGALAQVRIAFAVAFGLLTVYAAGIAINLARGRRFIDCGCGGAAQPLSGGLVARNVVLIAIAFVALSGVTARALSWIDGLSVLAGVAVCGAIYGAVNQLLAARARLEEWV